MARYVNVFEGKILRINLSTFHISWEDFKRYREFIGGRGVNQYILFHEMPLRKDPFDPSMLLAIGAGVLCGTPVPGACRLNIDSKSPLTGGIGSSNVGGYFCEKMRRAGITNIIISGRAPKLSYLYIEDDVVKIYDAESLRGKTVSETTKILKEIHGDDVSVMAVGPAGENLVRYACVIVDGARAAGRCGLGAIMGSKNIKAIVIRGTKEIRVHDAGRLQRAIEKTLEKLKNNEFNRRRMKYGVYCYEPWGIESPYRNFSGKIPPIENKMRLMPDEFLKYKVGQKSCSSCPIECWAIYEFEDDGREIRVEALQGNDIHNFGARLDIPDPNAILKLHGLCNDLGLDVDSVSGVIAWAMECFEKGILTEKDTGGLELTWGNVDIVVELLYKIAFREGFGDLLAEGCVRASKKIGRGSEKCCIHMKGQELFECMWLSPAWALGTAGSPRGGTHTRGAVIEERLRDADPKLLEKYFGISELGGIASYENKERLVVFFERLEAFLDSAGICVFTNSLRLDMLLPEDYAELFSAASGVNIDEDRLLWIGERIHTVEKAFNILHTGWSREDDMPPKRFVEVPLAGKYSINLREWEAMLDRYYALHGWDSRGWPTKKRLLELKLEDVLKRLESAGIALGEE